MADRRFGRHMLWLCVILAVFGFVLNSRPRWESIARDHAFEPDARREQPARASIEGPFLSAAAAAFAPHPPARVANVFTVPASFHWHAPELVEQPALEVAVLPQAAEVAPRVASQPVLAEVNSPVLKQPAAVEVAVLPAPEPAPAEAEVAMVPESVESELDAEPLVTVEAAPPQWLHPQELVARLEHLASFEPAAPWAQQVLGLLAELTTFRPDQPQFPFVLEQLRQAAHDAETTLAASEGTPGVKSWRRAHHALSRRLDVWTLLPAVANPAVAATPDRARLALCLANVEALIETPEAGAAWRNYLLLETLQSLAQEEQPAPDAARQLTRRVLQKLHRSDLTAEQQRFLSFAPIAALSRELTAWSAEPLEAELLLARIEQFEATHLPGDAQAVALAAFQLASSADAPTQALGRQIATHYRGPNVRFTLTGQLLNQLLPQREAATEPVYSVILGIPARGCATTATQVNVRLVPDARRLLLALETRGDIQSSTTSRSGPVALDGYSNSSFTAHKQLEITIHGIRAETSNVEVDANSRLRDIRTDYDAVPLLGSFIRSYALDEYNASRGQARRQVEAQIASRARQEIDDTADTRFAALNEKLETRVLEPLAGMRLEPELIDAQTTDERLTMRLRLATEEQLGAHTPRPRAMSDSLASLQIHQSALNNLLEQLDVDGRVFVAPDLFRHVFTKLNLDAEKIPADVPKNLQVAFADQDALRVQFRDGRIHFEISLAELELEGKYFRDLLVRVRYRPEAAGPTMQLVRDGTVQLEGERLNTRSQIMLRGLFSRIFSRDGRWTIMEQQFATNPQFKDLQLTQFVIEDGWISVALSPRRAETEATVALAKEVARD